MCDSQGIQQYSDKLHDEVNDKLRIVHMLLTNKDPEEAQRTSKTLNILLVEDNMADVDMTRSALQKSNIGYELVVINTGEEAIKYLEREPRYREMPVPDVIVLDTDLPSLSAEDVLNWIQTHDYLKWIPTIIASRDEAEAKKLTNQTINPSVHVSKPLKSAEFLRALDSFKKFWHLGDNLKSLANGALTA